MAAKNEDTQVEKVEVPVSLEPEQADKTQEVKVEKKGVLLSFKEGEDFYVQPESVPVWLDKGAKLK